jgi:glycosyltransferase involved in cell wall biosynthesis
VTARTLSGPIRLVRRKTSVVYPGLGEQREREARPAGSGRLRVAFVGRLAPRKGVAELLSAVALLVSRGVDVELQIFGTPPPGQEWREAEYRRRAASLGLGDVARFEGFIADVPCRLASVDVLVVPSQRPEPFGLVVLEGMAGGCAVVACRNGGGSDEILEHGVTGLYCGRTPSSIAAAIERLASEPGLRERLGDRASAAVRETYSEGRYCDGVLRVYRDMLGRSGASTEDTPRW